MADTPRCVSPRVLLVEDDLPVPRQAAPAVILGPAEADPAVRSQAPLPGHALGDELVRAAGAALAGQAGELGRRQLSRQPAAHLTPELLVVHEAPPSSRAASRIVRASCPASESVPVSALCACARWWSPNAESIPTCSPIASSAWL